MKKITLILAVFLISAGTMFSQYAVPKGGKQLNAGFGLESKGLPIYVGLDFGVHKDISVGAEVSFRSYKDYGYNYNIFGISGNFNYHFNYLLGISKEWDIYAGINVGYFYWDYPSEWNYSKSSPLGLGSQIGFRYYISPKFGLNLEFGGGNAFSGGKFGISFKF